MREIGLYFYWVVSLPDLGIRLILASYKKFGGVPPFISSDKIKKNLHKTFCESLLEFSSECLILQPFFGEF